MIYLKYENSQSKKKLQGSQTYEYRERYFDSYVEQTEKKCKRKEKGFSFCLQPLAFPCYSN
jgi:hypothetical protein